jgi:hypothetical protein
MHLDFEHVQECIGNGHKPAWQGQGQQRWGKLRRVQKALDME